MKRCTNRAKVPERAKQSEWPPPAAEPPWELHGSWGINLIHATRGNHTGRRPSDEPFKMLTLGVPYVAGSPKSWGDEIYWAGYSHFRIERSVTDAEVDPLLFAVLHAIDAFRSSVNVDDVGMPLDSANRLGRAGEPNFVDVGDVDRYIAIPGSQPGDVGLAIGSDGDT